MPKNPIDFEKIRKNLRKNGRIWENTKNPRESERPLEIS